MNSFDFKQVNNCIDNEILSSLKELKNDLINLHEKFGEDYDSLFKEVEQIVKNFEESYINGTKLESSRYKYQKNDLGTVKKAQFLLNSFLKNRKLNEIVYQFATSPLSRELGKRTYIWKYISQTEMAYFSSLVFLYETYFKQLNKRNLDKKSILTIKQIEKVFQNIDDIKETAKTMLKKFESTCRGWPDSPVMIGSVFVSSMDQIIEVYSKYSKGIVDAIKAFSKYKRTNESFSVFIDQNAPSSDEFDKKSFPKLLLLPLNRISEYSNLLSDLLYLTTESHADFKDLSLAYQKIHQLELDIQIMRNDAIKLLNFDQILSQIKGNIPNLLPKSEIREFIREGPIRLIQERSSKRCYMYLFSDCLLIADWNELNDEKVFTLLIWLKGSVVRESAKNFENYIFTITKDNTHYHLSSNTKMEMFSWIEDITLITLNIENRRDKRFR